MSPCFPPPAFPVFLTTGFLCNSHPRKLNDFHVHRLVGPPAQSTLAPSHGPKKQPGTLQLSSHFLPSSCASILPSPFGLYGFAYLGHFHFHMEGTMWPLRTGFFHSAQCFQGLSLLQHLSVLYASFWLSSTPLSHPAHSVYPTPVDGHLGCFPLLVISNAASVHTVYEILCERTHAFSSRGYDIWE